ncbi:MAG: bifunctional phosphoribosylaminoimidazolecarboxamide formyltransferase/IMP cyclohydrolase [Bacteroidales bacterium]|nr:bifunctional phosphoribosylaminoimidazolecarboxamide formyltransferase/IMP cyclohydrolase [Bacteroidales bacterium]MDD3700048.1 bifunctional phosphoribosylaminoimidazolecarboxamide formyltransferase/IMP cyclohydrolase [Bacteroidales bacterium]MDY0368820.1 bifunctional phosphoribosylaminoimidazolecarboxamide formyltransferase/IMP cyclohydrolase [Bacteroidales bacterium]
MKKIRTALLSAYCKEELAPIATLLQQHQVQLFATGGTYDFIHNLNIQVEKIEDLTGYPSFLGGRVKTLHPKVFGGILGRPSIASDAEEMEAYQIQSFDLVIVDLYPFEKTVEQSNDQAQIIENIDIGGVSLIRAAAKNFEEVLLAPSSHYFEEIYSLLKQQHCSSNMADRKRFATYGFAVSSHYDSRIYNWFATDSSAELRLSLPAGQPLRYGENPHQKAVFYGGLTSIFEQLHGKPLSYNNLLDLDAGLSLIAEFEETAFAILKHNNACGFAIHDELVQAFEAALAGDPVSAFGGILITNKPIDLQTAAKIDQQFFEILIAPDFEAPAFELLASRKNRILLKMKPSTFPAFQYRSILGGILQQDKDLQSETAADLTTVSQRHADDREIHDLLIANKLVKHTRSNAIVLVKNGQLIGSGMGQTSRVDALKQAIAKANETASDLHGSVMASDAFFPFSDSVTLAHQAGITAVIQPGGSIRDQESIDACNKYDMAMVFTGIRHFKH